MGQPFVDYGRQMHLVGETWVSEGPNFAPYYNGLTLHVVPLAYRLRWRPEEQAALIEHFTDFVIAC